jgi:hypothetical protein
LLAALFTGGAFLVLGLLARLIRGEYGSDLLAGISIVTSVVLHTRTSSTRVDVLAGPTLSRLGDGP